MKYIMFTIVLLLFSYCVHGQIEAKVPVTEQTLIWNDEFDYEGLPDNTKWGYEEGFVRNNEPQYYTVNRKQNAFIKDGMLTITAILEEYHGAQYTSACINTKGKFEFTNGRLEVRAKIPTGKGIWPAIWTLGTNINEVSWPSCGEIDIMEYWGHNPKSIHANVHTKDYNHSKGNGRGGKIEVDKPWENFHIYAVEWHSDRLDFYFDNVLYYSCKKKGEGIGEWPFDSPQYLLINLALVSNKNIIDNDIFPSTYLIDYVRFYKFSQ